MLFTLVEDGSVWYNGSWKYSPEGRSVANDHEFQNALAKMKNTKAKVQGCLACEHRIKVNLGGKHTFECRQSYFAFGRETFWGVTIAMHRGERVHDVREQKAAIEPKLRANEIGSEFAIFFLSSAVLYVCDVLCCARS